MCRSSDDVDGVHVEVDTDVVIVSHHNDVHPESQPRHVGGPPGLLSGQQPAGPVGVTAEAILEEIQGGLGCHHQQVSLQIMVVVKGFWFDKIHSMRKIFEDIGMRMQYCKC